MSIVAHGIRRQVELEQFDLVLGHSVDTLPSICDAARARGAKVVFDSMEFHSDMGEGQGRLARQLVQTIESKYLPRCDLVLTSSPEMAQALRSLYGLKAVLPVYNAAPITKKLRSKVDDGRLHLYWRNSTVGLSQRGLDDALRALSTLPDDIILNIQGRPGRGMSSLKKRISDLDIEHRAILHDAYPLGDAVLCASPYSIGLCLERDVCENHRLTVSNKIFDYLMAGLAVVCSNLPGLASVLDEADAGLLFEPGSVEELAAAIRYLYENQERLKQLQNNARTYAMTRVNEESELSRFGDEIRQLGFQR
jgi:glycosyltransferase involved in cell wall biosynthesis